MKKNLLKLFALAAVAVSMTFVSCSSEDPAEPLNVNMTATATITGFVTYTPDLVSGSLAYPTDAEMANNIVATVTYNSVNSHAAGGSFKVPASYNATTGKYTISVPATTTGTNVTITFSMFNGKLKQSATVTKQGYWRPSSTTISQSVVSGQVLAAPTVNYNFTEAPVQ